MNTTAEHPGLEFHEDVTPGQREGKFLVDFAGACSFWRLAAPYLRPLPPHPDRPISYSRTTYFDTLDSAYYRSSSGPIARRIRLREYATADTADGLPVLSPECYLEFKRTAGGVRAKSRVRLRPEALGACLEKLANVPLVACLTTWYRRTAFAGRSDRVRVTLDDRICFCSPRRPGGCVGLEPPGVVARGPEFVLEIKTWEEPAWLVAALHGLSESVGFSKFSAGMRVVEERRLAPKAGIPNCYPRETSLPERDAEPALAPLRFSQSAGHGDCNSRLT